MIKQLNSKLKELDISMCQVLDDIMRFTEPRKDDLDKLSLLYKETIACYMQNTTKYKLDYLKYSDLNEIEEILKAYGYLPNNAKDHVEHNVKQTDNSIIAYTESPTLEDNDTVSDVIPSEKENIFVEQTNPFNANGPVYAFTNEALNQYMCNYDFSDKSVLASLGSGDFSLNAYLLGANSIDTFDINLYTHYFYQLKKSLILRYNYEQFCELIKNPKSIFEKFDDYKDILDTQSKSFFERLIKIYNGKFDDLLRKMYIDKVGEEKNQWNESNTFATFEELFLISSYKNYYLQSKENYNKLKISLKEHINDPFYFVNIFDFYTDKKYDIIYLSNIGDYSKNEEEFQNFVLSIREKFLNEGGIIIIASITNHIMMSPDVASRTKMDWDNMKTFNATHKGIAELPICNLGIQNIYTTYPYEKKKHHSF